MGKYRSWGYSPAQDQAAVRPGWRDFSLESIEGSLLPYGNGRSYGDSCLNSAGRVIDCRQLNRFIAFDREQGILRCEAGVSFEAILEVIVPAGWFLPVTPGTKFVTVGGAIANDIHGKNHHRDGTIGRHVRNFELLRSDGQKLLCSPESNPEFFSATIGGLGLTGCISWAEMQLIPISSSTVDVETSVFHGLDEFYELSAAAHEDYQYTIAWLDCVAEGDRFARGIFMKANHSAGGGIHPAKKSSLPLSVPINFPKWALNKYSVKAFNTCYFYSQKRHAGTNTRQQFDPFFYPLDGIENWNRIYGKDGFFQYQFIVPGSEKLVMDELLRQIVSSGLGSFLAVLKEFGAKKSPGMLSFPRPGICLALDLANRGTRTLRVLDELDQLVMKAGGIVYPAKDNRMSGGAFRAYYPQYEAFSRYIDPRFSSDFWKRVTNGT
ncbi:MAG: FAD-binding oxidoreductase [Gammaproteobacteria bacterium]|nr:FAD-binding oxidoreductase [Gammaproteobacteria bacterium]